MGKRIFAAILCLCMLLTLLPGTALAAGSEIQLGTGGIASPSSTGDTYHHVYFGQYPVLSAGGAVPIQWRVLDASKTNTNNTNGMFLLTEDLLVVSQDDEWKFNGTSNNTYQGSNLEVSINDLVDDTDKFTLVEQGAMLATTKSDDRYVSTTDSSLSFKQVNNILDNDKLFSLSAEEVQNGNFFPSEEKCAAKFPSENQTGSWWLRSGDEGNTTNAGAVMPDYPYDVVSVETTGMIWIRPAFNLDKSKVLFTSTNASGKGKEVGGSGLTAVDTEATTEWKLTLLDSARTFDVTTTTASTTTAGGNVQIPYTNAAIGTNEYISAMLMDSAGTNVLYYGRIMQSAAVDGTANIAIPALAAGSYTLKVFNEQYNGDKKTDYASAFQDITLTVTAPQPQPPVILDPTAPKTVPVTVGSPVTLTVTATGAVRYQWFYKPNGSASFAPINTATGASCTTPAITPANNGDQYQCVVIGNGTEAMSPIFTLQITTPGGGEPGGDAGNGGADVPQTGDGTPIAGLMAIAALCGIGLVVGRRKREE